jgi:thiol-disulfide isomerase/thioredoxin
MSGLAQTIATWIMTGVIMIAGSAAAWAGNTAPDATSQAPARLLARGAMANFSFLAPPTPAPAVPFRRENGDDVRLADFAGKVVLVNFWATWCGPCRREMPALDRLQAMLGGNDFQVLAISLDRKGAPVARKFMDEVAARHLPLFVDPKSRLSRAMGALGLPTSMLLDRAGRVVGRLVGPAEWDSQEAQTLIRHLIDEPTG